MPLGTPLPVALVQQYSAFGATKGAAPHDSHRTNSIQPVGVLHAVQLDAGVVPFRPGAGFAELGLGAP